jgi:hypothetical protein
MDGKGDEKGNVEPKLDPTDEIEVRKFDAMVEPASADRKAEIRSRMFSTDANDKIIPLPPPKAPTPENDAPLLWCITAAFFVLGTATVIASRFFTIESNHLDVLVSISIFLLSACGVVGVWALWKSVRGVFIVDLDEQDK